MRLLDLSDTAVEIARSICESEAETEWKSLGDRTLSAWHFDLAKESFLKAGDLSALMLLLLATADRTALQDLAVKAERKGQDILVFATLFKLSDSKTCVDLLIHAHRAPEAALFARTYAPSQAGKAVEVCQSDLKTKGRPKIAASVAHPSINPELFEEGREGALSRRARGPISLEQVVDAEVAGAAVSRSAIAW